MVVADSYSEPQLIAIVSRYWLLLKPVEIFVGCPGTGWHNDVTVCKGGSTPSPAIVIDVVTDWSYALV